MFREKIRARMFELNITVKHLSEITEVDKTSISSFLSGKRAISNSNLEKLLTALRLTLVPKDGFKYGYNHTNNDSKSNLQI